MCLCSMNLKSPSQKYGTTTTLPQKITLKSATIISVMTCLKSEIKDFT